MVVPHTTMAAAEQVRNMHLLNLFQYVYTISPGIGILKDAHNEILYAPIQQLIIVRNYNEGFECFNLNLQL